MIFDYLGTKHKELCIVNRDRHGIVNGAGCDVVFERVHHFLKWALALPQEEVETVSEESGDAMAEEATPELAK